jgi:dynein heavy chain
MLQVVRLGQKGYLETIERAVANGDTVLLENLGETMDPVLDPLLGRNTIKRGELTTTVRVQCPHPPLAIWQTGITIPGNGVVRT